MSADLAASLADGHRARLDKIWATLTARQRRLVAKTLDQIEADLSDTKRGSWSAASSSSTLVQLAQSVRGLSSKQLALLRRALPGVASQAQSDTASWVRALDQSFLGSTTPLAWDSLEWLEQTRDPLMRSRLRIYSKSFQRYGAEAVSAIEDAVAQRVLVGTPWTEAREEVMDIVRDQVGGKQWMVDRIVRTESSTVANAVTLAALHAEDDDQDDPMLKKLVATFDAVTGQDSRSLHGQTRTLSEAFIDVRSGREYMAPPNRPNDREIVVGWRRSWGDDREFDEETAVEEPDEGWQVEDFDEDEGFDMDEAVKKAVEDAAKKAEEDAADTTAEGTAETEDASVKPLEPPGWAGTHTDAWKRAQKVTPYSLSSEYDPSDGSVTRGEVDDLATSLGWRKFKTNEPELYEAAAARFQQLASELRWSDGMPAELGEIFTKADASCGPDVININFSNLTNFEATTKRNAAVLAEGGVPWTTDAYSDTHTTKSKLLSTITHEWGHRIDFNLRKSSEGREVLAMWNAAVKEVNAATWPGKWTPDVTSVADRRNTWAMVSQYAASNPKVEGLAECFTLAADGKWSQIPSPLHAPLRLMLEPREGAMASRAVKAAAVIEKPSAKAVFETREEWRESLTDRQREAFTKWTKGGYKNMRRADATGDHNDDLAEIYEAMKRAPKYVGDGYRGLESMSPDAVTATTTPGTEIILDSLSSWSKARSVGEKFAKPGYGSSILWVLKATETTGGVDIQALSSHGMEREFIVPRGSHFVVVSSKLIRYSPERWEVTLREATKAERDARAARISKAE